MMKSKHTSISKSTDLKNGIGKEILIFKAWKAAENFAAFSYAVLLVLSMDISKNKVLFVA